MAQKVNLSKLKDEIENRKKEKHKIPSHLGETLMEGGAQETN